MTSVRSYCGALADATTLTDPILTTLPLKMTRLVSLEVSFVGDFVDPY